MPTFEELAKMLAAKEALEAKLAEMKKAGETFGGANQPDPSSPGSAETVVPLPEEKLRVAGKMKGKPIISGLAASPGVVTGKCNIIGDSKEKAKTIKEGDIVIAALWDRNWELDEYLKTAAALVENVGSASTYGCKVMRDIKKPCISGTYEISGQYATIVLKDGQQVVVQVPTGKVIKEHMKGGIMKPFPYKIGTVFEHVADDLSIEGHQHQLASKAAPAPAPAKPAPSSAGMSIEERVKAIRAKHQS